MKQAQTNNYLRDNLFKGVVFKLVKEEPELYAKTIERLGLYTSTQLR